MSGMLREHAARRCRSSAGVYFFVAAASEMGRNAATVSRALLKHSWGSNAKPGLPTSDAAGMSFTYRVWRCIQLIIRRSAGGFCHLALRMDSAPVVICVHVIDSHVPKKWKLLWEVGGMVCSRRL